MKKISIICIIVICALSFHAKGQSAAGIKADLNLSNMWINKSTNINVDMISLLVGLGVGYRF